MTLNDIKGYHALKTGLLHRSRRRRSLYSGEHHPQRNSRAARPQARHPGNGTTPELLHSAQDKIINTAMIDKLLQKINPISI